MIAPRKTNPSRIERIRLLFEEASTLPEGAQAEFLRKKCPDEQLRKEVEELLMDTGSMESEFEEIADQAIRAPISQLRRERKEGIEATDRATAYEDPEKSGERIGPYVLTRLLGEGGFGTVWEAQQESPVTRRVAIKFLKIGMATREIIRRFEAERQALAIMGHANIAQVYDAGATDSGRPYFVMEFVEGMPLTQFCDKYHLSLKQRLHVFNLICGAIQHAHQKGIVHRDLKPNNILVHYEDEETRLNPVLKIIDFGVAKVLRSTSSEHTMVTGLGQMIGTPAYMSPEQASFSIAIPDTRTDVYSLGILLYELLAGTLPFEADDFKDASIMEIQRIIQTKEPQRPSTRLVLLQKGSPEFLQQILDDRETDFKALHRALHTDLDWVIIRCLEKDPERRYSTANELLLDINRYLNSEPLVAGPPSATYRISKLVRRHRRTALASTFVVLSFVIGFIGTILGLVQATRARIAEAEQRQQAEARTKELEQVTAFQQSVFERLVPEQIGAEIFRSMLESYGEVLKVGNIPESEREAKVKALRQDLYQLNPTDLARQTFNDFVLTRSSQAISEQFSDQPMVEAALRQSLAESFRQIGLIQEAIGEQERCLELRQGMDAVVIAETKLALASIYKGGKFYSQARDILLELFEDIEDPIQDDLGPRILLNLGQLEFAMENWEAAESNIRQAHAEFVSILGEEHPLTLEAELESIRAKRHFNYDLGYNSRNYVREGAEIALQQEPLLETFLKKALLIVGEDHPLIWETRRNLVEAIALHSHIQEENLNEEVSRMGNQRAVEQLDMIFNSQKTILGTYHPRTLETRKLMIHFNQLESTEIDMPERNRALLGNMKSILSTQLEIYGENHPEVVKTMDAVSNLQREFGFPDEAIATMRRTISILKRTGQEFTEDTVNQYNKLCFSLLYEFDFEGAMAEAQNLINIVGKARGNIPERYVDVAHLRYIQALIVVNKLGQAYQLCEEWGMESAKGDVIEWMGKFDEVNSVDLQKLQEMRANGVKRAFNLRGWYINISWLLYVLGKFEESKFWLYEALACSQMTTDDDPRKLQSVESFAFLLAEVGDLENAKSCAHIWEDNREHFLRLYPNWAGDSPVFPYKQRNAYFTKEAYLLTSFYIWDTVGEVDKADDFLKQYFEFRNYLETDADTQIKTGYDRIVESEYPVQYVMRALKPLASRGNYQEAHELVTRFPTGFWRVWDSPQDPMYIWSQIVDFYQQWHEADPEGGHLEHAKPWQDQLDKFERRFARWRDYPIHTK